MTNHLPTAVRIDLSSGATETVAADLTPERAYTLAHALRRTLKPGERIYTETANGFRVIGNRS